MVNWVIERWRQYATVIIVIVVIIIIAGLAFIVSFTLSFYAPPLFKVTGLPLKVIVFCVLQIVVDVVTIISINTSLFGIRSLATPKPLTNEFMAIVNIR
jgi:hypothetical protein